MDKENLRRCKKCLLKDFDYDKYMNELHRYIEILDKDVRCSKEHYEERLQICVSCEKLNEGTCLGCGCFVELRAAVNKNRCPYKKW